MSFKQITIVGTGLIGGSLGLALKRVRFRGKVVGCDRAEVLKLARQRGAIDRGETDCGPALRGADLVILATPVGAIIDFLDRFGPALGKRVFVTDVGSTKQEIVARARHVFGPDAATRFLGGHPMAGKEHGGIAHADAALFRDALWFLTPTHDQDLDVAPAADWAELIAAIGARVTTITPEAHDKLVAWTSHLPQLLSTALASSLADFAEQLAADSDDDIEVREAGGRGLRDMTRLAASPYDMWRDIALTNTANIADALLQLEQKLAHIRENLRTRELEAEFRRAQDQGQSQSFNAEAPSPPRKSKKPSKRNKNEKKDKNNKQKKKRKQKKKTSASSAPRR